MVERLRDLQEYARVIDLVDVSQLRVPAHRPLIGAEGIRDLAGELVEEGSEKRVGGLGDRRLVTRHMDLAVAMKHLDPEGIADLAQMLVACSEQRQQRLGIDQRNGGFEHAMPWAFSFVPLPA